MPFDDAGWPHDSGERARERAVLIAARWRIRWPWRWGKGYRPFGVMFGRLCVMEALMAAEADMDSRVSAGHRLRRLIPAGYVSTADYNDHPTTRHRDILALLDAAIAEIA